MSDYDRLFGLRGQSMGGPKVTSIEAPSYCASGTYTFTAPATGYYKFVLWGGGGGGYNGGSGAGGSSGAYAEFTRLMTWGERATVVVGVPGPLSTPGGDSSVTFADGKVVTAGGGGGGGTSTTVGVASGGDVNINGSAPGLVGGAGNAGGGTAGGAGGSAIASSFAGGGAPGNTPYKGGVGGTYQTIAPGIGGGGYGNSVDGSRSSPGGSGAVLVQCTRRA
jgi:hypothetical protein